MTSQQASIIKCGAYLTGGGIDTSRIVDAAKSLNDGGANSESVYLAALTLNRPDDTDVNVDLALQAQEACNDTGLDGYIYIGNLAATGTALSNAFGGSGIPNLDDPSSIDPNDIDTAIDNCVGNSACEDIVADSAVELADSYCDSNAGKDDEFCTDIQDAIDSAGGDKSVLTESLLCLLDGQPENCVP
jgi:hypothetical protein